MAYQAEGEKLQKDYLANPDRFAPYADWCRKAGDLDLALEIVRAGLSKKPNYLSGHIILGRCLVDQKNDLEAAKVFEHVLVLDAENIIALRFLAEITERQGDTASAERWLKRLLDVDPSNDDAVESLKRLASVSPAPAPVPPAPPEVPAPAVDTVSGFESTAIEATPSLEPAFEMPAAPEPVASGNDFMIEQASSPFETPTEPSQAGGDQFGMEPTEVSLGDGPQAGSGMLDLQPAESEMVFDESAPPRSALPDAPPPTEPPMLTFLDTTPEPTPVPEPLAAMSLEPEPPPPAPSRKSVAAPAPSGDLQLIMPDDVDPEPVTPRRSVAAQAPPPQPRPAPAPAIGEPEPVITETMAEVYARQGLIAEARDVYRKLIQLRPGEPALRQRLAELEQQRTSPPRGIPAPPAPPAPPKPRFGVAAPSGQSARSLFGGVLSAKPGAPPPAPEPVQAPPPPVAPPASPMSMDAAFAEEPIQAQGAPTRPTSDELSLAAVFGEEPMGPPASAKPPAEPPAANAPGGGFSFDEFFGAKKGEGTPPPPSADAPPAESEGHSPDDFVSWLKGLKS